MALKRTSSAGTPARRPGGVRIIGGNLRGSKLAVPDLPGLRPTPDRVRETLFNWLMPVISGARCCDLFAGTGALGVEALSRGAAWCDFVESDAGLAQALRDNLARLKQSTAKVYHAAAHDALAALAGNRYDIVFLDPPFDAGLWQASAQQLESAAALNSHAMIYIESPRDRTFSLPPLWQSWRESAAGNVRYALYRRSAKLAQE